MLCSRWRWRQGVSKTSQDQAIVVRSAAAVIERGMPMLHNPKHEAFARNLVEMTKTGGTQGNAYSKAGFKAEGAAADVCASKLLKITKNGIAQRVQELMRNGAKRAEVSVASLLAELEEARAGAADDRQFAAVTGAIMAKAKLSGMLVDKLEVGGPGAFDQCQSIREVAEAVLAQEPIDELIASIDAFKDELLAVAADRAQLIVPAAPDLSPRPSNGAAMSLQYLRPKRYR
jgi:phage terminase small subunit